MRAILAIVVIFAVSGCAGMHHHGCKPQEKEVYNSPTLWQSLKSLHMAKTKESPAVQKKFSWAPKWWSRG